MKRIGIDIGGTFTDFIMTSDTGEQLFKLSTSKTQPYRVIMRGLAKFLTKVNANEVDFIAHGSTVATNAVIEHQGVKTGLITTKGFRDVLEIGVLRRPAEAIYNVQYNKPPPIVPRYLRAEVNERVNYKGEILVKLNEKEAENVVEKLVAENVEAIAICFLFSFLNPTNEKKMEKLIKRTFPHIYVALSSEVLPEYREYERTTTTVITTYLSLLISRYLEDIANELEHRNFSKDKFYVMQSNGGLTTPMYAAKHSVNMILSGPAAAVKGISFLASLAGFKDIVSVDMGGTSCDVALIKDGETITTTDKKILEMPVKIPMFDIQTVGAGGGSIAWVDKSDVLKVGPKSAGSSPGPACYGKGGKNPTVTDADLILGFINPSNFLGGEMELFPEKSVNAIKEQICSKIEKDIIDVAYWIYRIVNANMAGAVRVVTIEKGYDPKEFMLAALGGAGPVHAASLMEELQIPWLFIPLHPGNISAFGLTVTDLVHDYVQAYVKRIDRIEPKEIDRAYNNLQKKALGELRRSKIPYIQSIFVKSADLRYVGQGYTLNVTINKHLSSNKILDSLIEMFYRKFRKVFGFYVTDNPVELVNLRLKVVNILKKSQFAPKKGKTKKAPIDAVKGYRKVFFHGGDSPVNCTIYVRKRLLPGNVVAGPAIIEQPDTTVVILPSMVGTVDKFGNIIVGKKEWKKDG